MKFLRLNRITELIVGVHEENVWQSRKVRLFLIYFFPPWSFHRYRSLFTPHTISPQLFPHCFVILFVTDTVELSIYLKAGCNNSYSNCLAIISPFVFLNNGQDIGQTKSSAIISSLTMPICCSDSEMVNRRFIYGLATRNIFPAPESFPVFKSAF